MRSLAVRLTLMLLAVAAMAAAAYLTWAAEMRAVQARQAAEAFEHARLASAREVLELRAAQQAYVASGQSEAFWIGKVAASVEALRTGLASLAASTPSDRVREVLDSAMQALQDFEQVDRRARNYASSGQKLLASDMIFSDGLDTTGRISAALDDAKTMAASDSGAVLADVRREQLLAGGAASAVVLIALLLLTPRPREEHTTSEALGTATTVASPQAPPVDAERRQEPMPPAAPPVEFERLAAICTDLARLSDSSSLPSVLERAAAALDAAGLVLWIADPDGNELMPVAAHGYPATVLSRMGNLRTDAENATASAFRTGLVQTVRADAMSHGAIAAPLVTPSGCRGVISAEVKNDGEKQPARLAAAAILAAQLATLVGAPARPQERTAAI